MAQQYRYKEMVRGIESACISKVIDEFVHKKRDREIIKLSLLDDISYTHIADIIEPWVSPRTIQDIMNRWMPVIMEHLKR